MWTKLTKFFFSLFHSFAKCRNISGIRIDTHNRRQRRQQLVGVIKLRTVITIKRAFNFCGIIRAEAVANLIHRPIQQQTHPPNQLLHQKWGSKSMSSLLRQSNVSHIHSFNEIRQFLNCTASTFDFVCLCGLMCEWRWWQQQKSGSLAINWVELRRINDLNADIMWFERQKLWKLRKS